MDKLWPAYRDSNALSTALATGVEFEDRLLQIAAASPEREAGLERFAQGKRA